MKKFAAMLVCLTAMVSSLVSAQEPVQTSIRQSAVFLEQIIGTWATVLPSWNRAPESADWRMARQRCTTPIDSMQPKAIENADPKPPAADMMFGNVVFYRGPQGLQQYSVTDNEIRLFPDLRVGSAKKWIAGLSNQRQRWCHGFDCRQNTVRHGTNHRDGSPRRAIHALCPGMMLTGLPA
jgi:hypothetical protein